MTTNSDVKFRHMRYSDQQGNSSNMGGITFAFRQVDKNEIRVAVAFCSEQDNFSRKRGREISLGRLERGRNYTVQATWEKFHEYAWVNDVLDKFWADSRAENK